MQGNKGSTNYKDLLNFLLITFVGVIIIVYFYKLYNAIILYLDYQIACGNIHGCNETKCYPYNDVICNIDMTEILLTELAFIPLASTIIFVVIRALLLR